MGDGQMTGDRPTPPVGETGPEERVLVCPFCGCEARTRGIGALHCGPHRVGDTYFPARQMRERYGTPSPDAPAQEKP